MSQSDDSVQYDGAERRERHQRDSTRVSFGPTSPTSPSSWRASTLTYVPPDHETDESNATKIDHEPVKFPTQFRTTLFPFSRRVPTVAAHAGDYDKKYPEDPHSQELGPNSRVYKVYLDEAFKRDTEAMDSWRDSLDVLLIFAGLFSAVVTTFVVQFSSNLEPDYARMNAYLQFENNALLRAISSNAPTSNVSPSPLSPYEGFVTGRKDAWVNGLWYLSLILSLSTAMITMLVKQWLKHHASFIPGSPQDRARVTEARRRAAHFWRLTAIVGALPLLMHAAVFIFFAGVALQLFSKDIVISSVIIGIICLTGLFYAVTTLLPLIFPHCCYVTPLTLSMYAAWRSTHNFWSAILTYCVHVIKSWIRGGEKVAKFKHSKKAASTLRRRLREVFKWQPISHAERITALQDVDVADVHILEWLHSVASLNPSVPPIICEAISGTREGFTQLSAVRGFSKSIFEDWNSEVGQLMNISHASRIERYLRMNAVLYESERNFSILYRHPHCIGAVVLASLTDESFLQQYQKVQMHCCRYKIETAQSSQELDYSHWIHALLLLSMTGVKGAELPNAPMVKLHPAAWVNIFTYITDFAKARPDSDALEPTIECVRKQVKILLPAILNHHFRSPKDREPYFAEKRSENDQRNNRVDPVTILELPPGHCRTQLLQFLYVYSTPTPEHDFSLYVDFPSFTGNIVELWHKALLLHLKQYGDDVFPESAAGVLRELVGVLLISTKEKKSMESLDSLGWSRRIFGRPHSSLELDVGELVRRCRKELKEALVSATLDILVPKADAQPQPSPTSNPRTSTISPTSNGHPRITLTVPGRASGVAVPRPRIARSIAPYQQNLTIGVQLVTLIEVLYRIYSSESAGTSNHRLSIMDKALRRISWLPASDSANITNPPNPTTSNNATNLSKVGTDLLSIILQTILKTDSDLPELPPRGDPGALVAKIPRSSADMALAELSRSLELGSHIFILSRGVDLVYDTLHLTNIEELRTGLKRAQLLLAVFRGSQIISSFVEGVLNSDDHGASACREYLCDDPETLNKCCRIMVWAEFALFTLNAGGVDDRRSYCHLSELRASNRSYLDKWWENVLTLTQIHPELFGEAWQYVFTKKTLHPSRPPKPQNNSSPPSSPTESTESLNQARIYNLPPTVALYRKRHYIWAEQIKDALDVSDLEALSPFHVYMTREELEALPYFKRRRWLDSLPPTGECIPVEFDLVQDDLTENLTAAEESTESSLGTTLIPLLKDSMRLRHMQKQKKVDAEAGQGDASKGA